MKCVLRYLTLFMILLFCASLYSQSNFSNILHGTRAGKDYWYGANSPAPNPGFETFTNVPIEQLGCTECHGPTDADGNTYGEDYTPNCVDCHPSNSAFSPDAIEVSQCYGCHGRQKTEAMALGYSDVHRDAGMVCWDCHTGNDMHGSSDPNVIFSSMLEPDAIEADCETCHPSGSLPPEHSNYDPASHNDKVHCTACHAQTVISCYNCHFESQVESHVKRAKQPLHNFVILANREKDGKVYPATFQSLTYQGNAFTAFGPFTSHTITKDGRGCSDCHYNMGQQNVAIAEYNQTGQIHFAKWNDADSTLSWLNGIVPMPFDYETAFKMDFITYNGNTSDPAGPSKNWSSIGKDTWDGHQFFFATPLTPEQMLKLGAVVGIEDGDVAEIPHKFTLKQNYPNPFNPATTIVFEVPKAAEIRLAVYNIIGQEVAVLAKGLYPPGIYEETFYGANLASGVYVYRLESENILLTRKMILMK